MLFADHAQVYSELCTLFRAQREQQLFVDQVLQATATEGLLEAMMNGV